MVEKKENNIKKQHYCITNVLLSLRLVICSIISLSYSYNSQNVIKIVRFCKIWLQCVTKVPKKNLISRIKKVKINR